MSTSSAARKRTFLLAAPAIVLTFVFLVRSYLATSRLGWDTLTYLAAGERLDAHHALYALGPGDRWVWINPPYWHVPLFYPPTIAVLWQPLAVLGEPAVAMWVVANAICLALGAMWIIRQSGMPGAVLALILSPAFAWEIAVGNVHGFILGALVLVHARPRAGAVAIGILTAVKLTPAVIIVWMISTERGRQARIALSTAVFALVAATLAVGVDVTLQYVAAVRAAAPSVLSIPGLLEALGLPYSRAIGWCVIAFGVVEVVLLRRTRWAWVAAVATLALTAPVVNVPTLSILLALAIRPAPLPVRGDPRDAGGAAFAT